MHAFHFVNWFSLLPWLLRVTTLLYEVVAWTEICCGFFIRLLDGAVITGFHQCVLSPLEYSL